MTSKDSKIRSTPLVSVAMTEAGTKQTRAKSVIVEKVSRRAVTPPMGPLRKAPCCSSPITACWIRDQL
jgi:hypothetical protein